MNRWWTLVLHNVIPKYMSNIFVLIGFIRRTQYAQHSQIKSERRKHTSNKRKSRGICELVLELGT